MTETFDPSIIQYFNAIEVIGDLITNNVEDVRKDRTNSRWVYPTFPKNNVNLPQVTIEQGAVLYENDSAGNYLYSEDRDDGGYREVYYKKATIPVLVHIITARDSEFNITTNGQTLTLSNKPLNLYIANNVKNTFFSKREEILPYFDDFKVENISSVYENNKGGWATTITCQIKVKDLWSREYKEGDLIAVANLGVAIITT